VFAPAPSTIAHPHISSKASIVRAQVVSGYGAPHDSSRTRLISLPELLCYRSVMTQRRTRGSRFSRSCWAIYTALAVTPFLCVADQALGHKGLLPCNATALCIALLLPFAARELLSNLRARRGLSFLKPILANTLPLGAFFLVAMVALALGILPDAHWEDGGKWIFIIPYGLGVSMVSVYLGTGNEVAEHLPVYVGIALSLLAWSIWFDLSYPGSFADITKRAAGFPGNANFSALVAVIVCSAGLNFGRRPESTSPHIRKAVRGEHRLWVDLLLLVLTFSIVVMTMSRSGIVNFSVLLSTFVYFRFFRSSYTMRQRILGAGAVLIVAALMVAMLPVFASLISTNESNNRLSRLLNNKQVDDGSAGTRLAAALDAIRLIEEAPVVGHGTGYSRTMLELPHNLYLMQWVNNGAVGVGAYLLFLATAFITFTARRCRNGQALILVTSVASLFSHNLLDQRPFLIIFGMLLTHSLASPLPQGTRRWPPPLRSVPRPGVAQHAA
jgi:O-antigen ligase